MAKTGHASVNGGVTAISDGEYLDTHILVKYYGNVKFEKN